MVFGLSLEEAARLHGHKGPWLVIGYRAGSKAKELLKPKTEHDIVCTVIVPKRTPYTCSADGVQASAGCTLGKLTIEVVNSDDGTVEFRFKNVKTGEGCAFRLRDGVAEHIESLCRESGLEAGARWVETAEFTTIFEEIKEL